MFHRQTPKYRKKIRQTDTLVQVYVCRIITQSSITAPYARNNLLAAFLVGALEVLIPFVLFVVNVHNLFI